MAKILVVDDSLQQCEVFAIALEPKGHEIVISNNIKSFKEILPKEASNTDLIILDINLPDGNGVETLIELQKNPVTKNIPVIMLSAELYKETAIKSLNSGAVDYVTKPYKPAELFARIDAALSIKQLPEEQQSTIDLEIKRKTVLTLTRELGTPLSGIKEQLEEVKESPGTQEISGKVDEILENISKIHNKLKEYINTE